MRGGRNPIIHILRDLHIHAGACLPSSSKLSEGKGGSTGFDRKSHIAFYWVGYMLPAGLFLLCSFLRVPFFHSSFPRRPYLTLYPFLSAVSYPSALLHPRAVIWIESKGSVLSNVHFASVRVKGAVRLLGHRRRRRRRRRTCTRVSEWEGPSFCVPYTHT